MDIYKAKYIHVNYAFFKPVFAHNQDFTCDMIGKAGLS